MLILIRRETSYTVFTHFDVLHMSIQSLTLDTLMFHTRLIESGSPLMRNLFVDHGCLKAGSVVVSVFCSNTAFRKNRCAYLIMLSV